jgi:hypothetical protein
MIGSNIETTGNIDVQMCSKTSYTTMTVELLHFGSFHTGIINVQLFFKTALIKPN